MSTPLWAPLLAELDRWSTQGRRLQLWLRDDDAIAPSPQLDRLAALAEHFDAPVLLAVIPFLAQPALCERLRSAPLLMPCQHGTWHRNHAPQGEKKSEFGSHRSRDIIGAEIAAGRRRLMDLFGPTLLPVFVPPWNRIDRDIAAGLPELGFSGLSCFRHFGFAAPRGFSVVNTQIDIIDWHGGRIGRPAPAIAEEIVTELTRRREAGIGNSPLGLLLHHRDHDDGAWAVLDALLGAMVHHPAVELVGLRQLFSGSNTA